MNCFTGPFPSSNSHVYILVCVYNVIKWVEGIACVPKDAQAVSNFKLKKKWFGDHRVFISDGGHTSATSIYKVIGK